MSGIMSIFTWSSKPSSHAQRKFIELIYNKTGKYANWDPPSKVEVGSYGRIDRETGDLTVEGSIYDDEFKENLIGVGIDVVGGEHRPEDCPDEVDFSTWSKNVKKLDISIETDADVPGIASATIKGTWEVKKGTTGAVLLMNNPRIKRISNDVLGKLAGIELLKDMHLVIKVFYCPAFSMYLSDKSGERISMALLGSAGVTAGGGVTMTWWSGTLAGLLRRGCKPDHCFTPLYELKHVRHKRTRRASPSPERRGEDLWIAPHPPWAPLDEEGNDVPVYVQQSENSSDEEYDSD